jgi:hypothetical protein
MAAGREEVCDGSGGLERAAEEERRQSSHEQNGGWG